MKTSALLTTALTIVILGGCLGPGGDDDGDGDHAALDAAGRTINIFDLGDALVHVHAAAGAVSVVEVKEGAASVVLPDAFWIHDGGRLHAPVGEAWDLEEEENVTFLVTPFTESFEVTLRAGTAEQQAFTVLSPYDESAAFVNGAFVYELLEEQRDLFPHRTPGHPNYEKAQDHFVDLFRAWGYDDVVKDPYGTNTLPQVEDLPRGIKPQSFANVHAYRPGSTDTIIAFGGHYDAIEATKEAAFDDTSGTMMTLALAKAFSEIETDVGLLFGLWGGEEDGILGSQFFVRTNPELVSKTILYVNLDVAAMAWPGPHGSPTPLLVATGPDGPVAETLTDQATALYETYLPELPTNMLIHETVAEGQATGAGVNAQSDHTPFMSAGVPVYFPFTSDIDLALWWIHGPQDTLYNMTYYMGTAERFDKESGENPEMDQEEAERGRELLIRSFESFLALPFYGTLEIDAGEWSSPRDVGGAP